MRQGSERPFVPFWGAYFLGVATGFILTPLVLSLLNGRRSTGYYAGEDLCAMTGFATTTLALGVAYTSFPRLRASAGSAAVAGLLSIPLSIALHLLIALATRLSSVSL